MAQVLCNVGQNEYLPYKPIKFYATPTGQDYAETGHIGVDVIANASYIAGIQTNGLQTWIPCGGAAMDALIAALTVTQGNVTLATGNLTVTTGNILATAGTITSGAALISSTSITATLGDITATNGDVVITEPAAGITMGAGPKILSGLGSPNGVLTAPLASVYLRSDAGNADEVIYVNTDGITGWTAMASV